MKHLPLLGSFCLAILLSSCIVRPNLTESYLKTHVKSNQVGELSQVSTLSLYQTKTDDLEADLELLAYQHAGQKRLLIAADRYQQAREKFEEKLGTVPEISYAVLNKEQCQAIIDHYDILITQIKEESPRKKESLHAYYPVSDELTISVKNTHNATVGRVIYLWIQGEKYGVRTSTFIEKLYLFLKY